MLHGKKNHCILFTYSEKGEIPQKYRLPSPKKSDFGNDDCRLYSDGIDLDQILCI